MGAVATRNPLWAEQVQPTGDQHPLQQEFDRQVAQLLPQRPQRQPRSIPSVRALHGPEELIRAVGMVPVFSSSASGAQGLYELAEGKPGEAAESFALMLVGGTVLREALEVMKTTRSVDALNTAVGTFLSHMHLPEGLAMAREALGERLANLSATFRILDHLKGAQTPGAAKLLFDTAATATDSQVRRHAIQSLLGRTDGEANRLVFDLLSGKSKSAILEVLEHTTNLEHLKQVMNHSNLEVRMGAARGMMRLLAQQVGNPDALKSLLRGFAETQKRGETDATMDALIGVIEKLVQS